MHQPASWRDDASIAETTRNLIMQHTSHPGLVGSLTCRLPTRPHLARRCEWVVSGYRRGTQPASTSPPVDAPIQNNGGGRCIFVNIASILMIYSSKYSLCSTVSEHVSCILIIFSSRCPEVKRSAKLLIASNFGPWWISILFNPWNQVWYYNAIMFSKEYITGIFFCFSCVHRTYMYAESGVQSQSWSS